MNFSLIDYTAFSLWIIISIIVSYILVKKFTFFRSNKNVQLILTLGLILGHLFYLIWKKFFLYVISFF